MAGGPSSRCPRLAGADCGRAEQAAAASAQVGKCSSADGSACEGGLQRKQAETENEHARVLYTLLSSVCQPYLTLTGEYFESITKID